MTTEDKPPAKTIKKPRIFFLLGLIATTGYLTFFSVKATTPEMNKIKLPPGFSIALYYKGIPSARSMALSPSGVLYVGSRKIDGDVTAIVDKNKDGVADASYVVGKKLYGPLGMAYKDGDLYVGQINGVVKLKDIDNHLANPPAPEAVNLKLPSDLAHGHKYIRFGPDGWLYIPVGAPCNVCERDWTKYACLMRMKPDGSNLELYAQGIRNTVGFDWHPLTKELWFTDNGRDWLGDDLPPDELNCAPHPGMNFGYPYRYGLNVKDPEYGAKRPNDADFTPCAVPLGAHVAALGMRFYTGDMFPPEYKNQIFIAEHGSWNRSKPSGYRIMCVKFSPGKQPTYEVFAEGFLNSAGIPTARPADLCQMADGSLLVSDDHGGTIYRITYKK
ncbi:MAG: sorbosone dehydrogenase family protein [Candidatus Melainabacteria bacterium]|nr:MAG: sorbosone dehydrogenase family protein [Candidatus Melainabacteria bacterium]